MSANEVLTLDKARFIFPVSGNEVVLEIDHKGNEAVFLNGNLLHSRKSLRLWGSYSVPIEDHEYELQVKVKSPLTGVIDVKLMKNGAILSYQRAKVKLGEKLKALSFFLLIAGCASLGVAIAQAIIPVWLSVLLYVAVVVGAVSVRGKNYVITEVGT